MAHQDNIIAAVPRKVYSNAHAYHIHSIAVNSDQETYISADDLRINLWNLGISDQSFSAYLDRVVANEDRALTSFPIAYSCFCLFPPCHLLVA